MIVFQFRNLTKWLIMIVALCLFFTIFTLPTRVMAREYLEDSTSSSIVEISGSIKCQYYSGTLNPNIVKALPFVEIQIFELGTWAGEPSWNSIAVDHADIDGRYSTELTLELPTHIEVWVWANIPDVAFVRDPWSMPYCIESSDHLVNPGITKLSIDFNIDTTQSEGPKWPVALDTIYDVRDWIKQKTTSIVTGGWTRGSVSVSLGGDQSRYSPISDTIDIADFDAESRYAIMHEYSHAIMNIAGSYPWKAPQTHDVYYETDEVFAFNEGWAEFLPCCIANDATMTNMQKSQINGIELQNNIESNHWEKYLDNSWQTGIPSDDFDGNIIEGSIASVLWDIFDDSTAIDQQVWGQPSTAQSDGVDIINRDDTYPTDGVIMATYEDNLQMGFDEIFDVIYYAKPETIKEFWEGWLSYGGVTGEQRNSLAVVHNLKAIFYSHGIKVESGFYPLPETAPQISNFQITSTAANGQYIFSNGPIYCSMQLNEVDLEDLNYLRVRLQYANDGSSDWVQFHTFDVGSIISGYYSSFYFYGSELPIGTLDIRAIVDDDMMDDTSSTIVKVIIDCTTPSSTVSVVAPYWNKLSPITVTALASDDISNNVKDVALWYRYKASNASGYVFSPWTMFGTDFNSPWSWNVATVNQGLFEFYSIATDYAGNVEDSPSSADASGGMDWTSPVKPTTLSPTTTQTVTGSPSPITFSWNTITDLSGIKGNIYELNVDTNTYYPTTNSKSVSLNSGAHTWKVRAQSDNAGNFGVWSTSIAFNVNIAAPPTGNVGGYVKTTAGDPISGAGVTLISATPMNVGDENSILGNADDNTILSYVQTNAQGAWSMSVLSGYYYTFTASATGYYSKQSQPIYVPPSGGATCNFYLQSRPSDGGGGGGGGGGCLAAGTMVLTPEGSIPVEDIQEGEIVLSYNEQTCAIEPNTVYYTTFHSDYDGYLFINDRLKITENHPVYTTEGLLDAGDLSVGNVMMTIDGEETITSISAIYDLTTVYNFEVSGNHNYFANGVLVHNVCTLKEGCPFVYYWNGERFVEENNILPQSTKPDRTQLDVGDCYMLQNEMQPVNGSYLLQLYEPALERTELDEVQLAIIDYNSDVSVAISPDGELFSYSDPAPIISCIDDEGTEVAELVDEMDDGMQIKMEHNRTLLLEFDEVGEAEIIKLVVAHKAIVEQFSYAIPVDPRYYKCSIHIQTMSELGEWQDFSSIPARLNDVVDVVDITGLRDVINSGLQLRLLITGTHIIDFIGLDISTEDDFDVEYVHPTYVAYSNSTDSSNMASRLASSDKNYVTLSPRQTIELSFPFIVEEKAYRAVAFLGFGHYYTLSEIAINQPVQVKTTIVGAIDGTITFSLNEVAYNGTEEQISGVCINVSDWPSGESIISFTQDTRQRYTLSARFQGLEQAATIMCEVTSVRGSAMCCLTYEPSMGSDAYVSTSLDNILWNVTGAAFDKVKNHYNILKNTLLYFDLDDYYDYDVESWSNYTWDFGDGLKTGDICPTHEYSATGRYILNLSVQNADPGAFFYTDTRLEVVSSIPIPSAVISQEVNVTLTIAGRKDNVVGARVYENSNLVLILDVKKTWYCVDTVSSVFEKHVGCEYTIELTYAASHRGSNPIWLEFKSGRGVTMFFKEFKTHNGYDQVVIVPTRFLEGAVDKNPTYNFNASTSYDIDGEIVSYLWDFGDGTTSNMSAVEHRYCHNGVYVVTLTIMDDDGLVTTIEREITVTAYKPPHRPRRPMK